MNHECSRGNNSTKKYSLNVPTFQCFVVDPIMSARGSKTTDAERRALESLMALEGDDEDEEEEAVPKTAARRSVSIHVDAERRPSNEGYESKSTLDSEAKHETSSIRRGSGSSQPQSSSGWNDAKPRSTSSDRSWADAKSSATSGTGSVRRDSKSGLDAKILSAAAAPVMPTHHAAYGVDEPTIDEADVPDNEEEEEQVLNSNGHGVIYAIAEQASSVSASESKVANDARKHLARKYTDYTTDAFATPSSASGGFDVDSNEFAIENFGKGRRSSLPFILWLHKILR